MLRRQRLADGLLLRRRFRCPDPVLLVTNVGGFSEHHHLERAELQPLRQRLIDSLQPTDGHKVATPVNWIDGEDVIVVPSLSDEEAGKLFPKGFKTVKPYLRYTPQPNK